VEFLTRIGPDFPRSQEISIDLRVTLFTFGLSVLTGVLSGLAPALASSGGDLHQALKRAGRTAGGGAEGGRMRNGLVVAETALACLLLIGAGLLIQSFFRLGRVDPGFNPRGVLTAYVMLPRATYKEAGRQAAFFKTVIERIEAIPGVEAAGASAAVPLTQTHHSGSFLVEGQAPRRPGEPIIQAEHPPVTPDYFRVIGLPLLRGRVIEESDDENSPAVAVVSETLARLYWPDKDPLGKRVSVENRDGQPVWREIVGVVGAVRHDGLAAESRPVIYVPQLQSPTSFMMLTVRTRTEPADFAPALRQAVASVDRDQPIIEVKTMERYIDDSLAQPRFQTRMLAIFAAVALVLAAIGIYGVMAYSVGQRTHEIGVRMALGARAGDVVKMVLWRGAGMALSGAGIGLLIAVGMARWMSKMLFGVSAYDPLTFVTVAGLLVAVALVACWLPARRAAHVDPMVALRRD
jgi:predicted permease